MHHSLVLDKAHLVFSPCQTVCPYTHAVFLGFVYLIDSIFGKVNADLQKDKKKNMLIRKLAISQPKTAEFVNYVDMVYADEAASSKAISQLWLQYYIKK